MLSIPFTWGLVIVGISENLCYNVICLAMWNCEISFCLCNLSADFLRCSLHFGVMLSLSLQTLRRGFLGYEKILFLIIFPQWYFTTIQIWFSCFGFSSYVLNLTLTIALGKNQIPILVTSSYWYSCSLSSGSFIIHWR